METSKPDSAHPDTKKLYRIGGISAIVLGVSYIIITVLYILGGALPDGAEEWLRHLAAHTAEWWGILSLSVLTDFLFLPLAWAIYAALNTIDRNTLLAGIGFLVFFVILDLAVTWPNYSALLTLSSQYSIAADDAQRMAFVAAAAYAVEVLGSTLFGVYAILVPSLGILLIGMVMRKGVFSKFTAYTGVATGVFGVIAVVGPFVVEALGLLAILASVLTTLWVLLAGYRLVGLSRL